MGLRIIGGFLKGRRLQSVEGLATRPTSDRLRESIFNILAAKARGAAVVDLFSGTGALGIEAISRGAEFAVFIENSRQALSVILKNLRSCGLEDRTRIFNWDVLQNLNCLKSSEHFFNLVFMDPPYGKDMIKPALFNLMRSQSLNHTAEIVVEHSPFEPIPEDLPGFSITRQRKYGKTLVSFLSYML